MREYNRRSVLSVLGAALPFGLGTRLAAAGRQATAPPELRFRPFEEAVRVAFQSPDPAAVVVGSTPGVPCRRIEVGHSDEVRAGLQGCHNDRPFAGFPAGHLRIVRAGSGPGPVRQGVRLHVCTVDVDRVGGRTDGPPTRPLDFSSLPPAAVFCDGLPPADRERSALTHAV